MSNDWTNPLTLGEVTFTPASQDGTFECPKRIFGSGYSYGGHDCGRQVVTIISGALRSDDGPRCAVHAAAVKRRVQNDMARIAKNRATEAMRDQRRSRDNAAKARIRAHGIDLNGHDYGSPSWTEVADWLDKVHPTNLNGGVL